MRKIIALYTMLVGAIFLASLVAVPVASAVDAEEYTADDGWAVGQTIALDWTWETMPADAKRGITALLALSGYELDKLNVNLDAAFYAYLTVDEVKAQEYVMSAKMAMKVDADASFGMSGEMLKAGKYNLTTADVFEDPTLFDLMDVDYEDLGIETVNTSVTLDLGMDFALIIGGTIVMEKETLAIKSLDLSLKAAAVISFNAKNLQTVESSLDELGYFDPIPDYILVNVTNNNFDVKVKASIDASLNVMFEPALNIYDFPMAVGNEWTIESDATINGEMKGFVDITGLPKDMEDELFDEEGGLYMAGFTKFPLVFDDYENDDIGIKDGKLEEFTIEIRADAYVYDTDTIDGRTVYLITAESDDGEFDYMYSSVLLDLFSISAIPDLGGDFGFSLEDLAAFGIEITNEEPTVDKAKDEIKSIENYHASVDKKANGSSLFGDLDIMAVLAVVVVAVIIGGAAVFFIRVMKK